MTATTLQAPTPDELSIPLPRHSLLRNLLGFTILFGFVGFFCTLAARNLLAFHTVNFWPLIASALWLLLVAAVLVVFLSDVGPRQLLVDFFANFSNHHFVCCTHAPDTTLVHFRYTFLGLPVDQLVVGASGITKVDWSTGQASYFARRDVGDWQVCVHFFRRAICRGRLPSLGNDDRQLYLLGVAAAHVPTDAFGRQLVDFLAAQARLHPVLLDSGNGFSFD